jgi:3-oxoacyl-(acyl-carrier-protein) synthase
MFDYPTVADLTDFIVSQFSSGEDEGEGGGGAGFEVSAQEPLSMLGSAARFPGCKSNSVEEYWSMLCMGKDMIREVPLERWDVDLYYDEDHNAAGKMYARYGGFISGLAEFDAKFFGIAVGEAQSMDPHQRILLEVAFESFWNGNFTKEDLMNSDTGSFIGCATLGGISVGDDDIGPFTNIGSFPSGNSGRVSHALGLKGPCFTIDTACSATIVALDSASNAMRLGKTKMACVAGSNLQLCPNTWIGFCKMGGLSVDGRCKTFDYSANGFTRSEGCGSVILSLGSRRQNRPEICAVQGSFVNQDGRSATITAPSGPAQQKVVQLALDDASTKPLEINAVEVHGTGTALGDPIEVGALKSTVGRDRPDDQALILAAVKSIIGHEEGAAGVAGICKLVGALKHRCFPRNLHLKKLNPNIDLTDFPVVMPDSITDWKASTLTSGISSFGFSGTNSHAILAETSTAQGDAIILDKVEPVPWNKKPFKLHDWSKGLWFAVDWRERLLEMKADVKGPCLLVGGGEAASALKQLLPDAECGAPDAIASILKQREWATVVFAEPLVADDPLLEGATLSALLQVMQEMIALNRECRMVALTRGAHSAGAPEGFGTGMVGSVVLGFMRTMLLEAPQLHPQTIDVGDLPPADVAQLVADELKASAQSMDVDVAYFGKKRCIPRLATTEAPHDTFSLKHPEGTYVITGGLGALGLLSAQTLVEMGLQSVVLLSRSGKVAGGDETLQSIYDELQASGATVNSWICDVSSAAEVKAVVERIQKELPNNPLRGIIHSAGVLDVLSIPKQTPDRFMSAMKPKVAGAWHLHEQTLSNGLRCFHGVFVHFNSDWHVECFKLFRVMCIFRCAGVMEASQRTNCRQRPVGTCS